jgi:hypothetical protein
VHRRQEQRRVHELLVEHHRKMQMRTGHTPGFAHFADDFATLD